MQGNQKRTLLICGTFLFLLGLMNGFVLPFFASPRVGLSAHLVGVQGGMVLMIFGLMWSYVKGSRVGLIIACWSSIYSMYITWLGILLSAVWGTHSLISGSDSQGISHDELNEKLHGANDQESVVFFLTMTGAIAIVVAVIIILRGLFANTVSSNDGETVR